MKKETLQCQLKIESNYEDSLGQTLEIEILQMAKK